MVFLYPRTQAHLLILLVEVKIRYLASLSTSMGVTMAFTNTPFQSAHGEVAVWCKYSSIETDDRIAR